ncbi:Slc28a3 [Columba guinea]|nr:Slc28a3 [Columba guinea]
MTHYPQSLIPKSKPRAKTSVVDVLVSIIADHMSSSVDHRRHWSHHELQFWGGTIIFAVKEIQLRGRVARLHVEILALADVALCNEWLSAFTQNLHALARHMEMKETTRDPPGVHNLAFRNDNEHVDVINLKGLRDNSQRIKNSQNKKTVLTNQADERINIEDERVSIEDERFNIEDYLHKTKNYSVDDKQPHFKGLLEKKYNEACEYCKEHKSRIQYGIYGILITAYLAGVIATCSLNFQRALPLFVVTVLAIFFICWDFLTTKALCVAFLITFIFWIIFDIAKRGYQHLISFGGLLMYVFLLFIFSKYPNRVVWRPVFSGIAMQFLLGILVMRTSMGFDMFNWLGIQIQTFLEYADAGAKFVFGEKYRDHFFAFKVLPVLVFFSTVMSMLYHIGFMQWLVAKTESPLMVRPYLPYITISEIHAIMTAGFSTIAGTVFGAYVSFGLVANILVNLISFLSLLAFIDSALSWVGDLFNYPQLNFEKICAYIFMPFSFMMGVDWEDSFIVAGLLGYKTFFNEFVAYERLSKLIHNREKGGKMYINGVKQYMTVRSEVIATYALCGFANFGSLGIVTGGLRMLVIPDLEVPCHIFLGNAFNSTDFPANSTKLVECCQQLFTRECVKKEKDICRGRLCFHSCACFYKAVNLSDEVGFGDSFSRITQLQLSCAQHHALCILAHVAKMAREHLFKELEFTYCDEEHPRKA